MKVKSTSSTTEAEAVEAKQVDSTRERLLKSAVEIFGNLGFNGASTRAIAEKAGANIQAIPYYFGSKEGLYCAAAAYLGGIVASATEEAREQALHSLNEAQAKGEFLDREKACSLLRDLAENLIVVLLSPEMASGAQLVLREQMTPTTAFEHLYQKIIGPMSDVCARLIAAILEVRDPFCKRIRLRTFSFMGGLFVFRYGHATLLALLDKEEIGTRDIHDIKKLIGETIASLAGK